MTRLPPRNWKPDLSALVLGRGRSGVGARIPGVILPIFHGTLQIRLVALVLLLRYQPDRSRVLGSKRPGALPGDPAVRGAAQREKEKEQ